MTNSTSAGADSPLPGIAAALRRERVRVGVSLSEVAARAGVSKSTLSQLEAGIGNPSLETLWRLCTALEIPFGRLVDPARPPVRLIRAGEGTAVASDQADYRATLLAPNPGTSRRDVYRLVAEPGRARLSEPHAPGVVEHVVLCAGRALVGPVDDPVRLHPGDYLAYPGDLPHVFEAEEAGTWAVLVSEHA